MVHLVNMSGVDLRGPSNAVVAVILLASSLPMVIFVRRPWTYLMGVPYWLVLALTLLGLWRGMFELTPSMRGPPPEVISAIRALSIPVNNELSEPLSELPE